MIMTRQEFLINAHLQDQALTLWLEQRWIIPDETASEMHFSERDLARARLIQDLKDDFEVNEAGIALILHLVDQLNGVRDALTLLQETSRHPDR